ncbi:MAG: 30S ribosomal protein S2, partial [Cyanobacteria bacterium J06636_27]
STSFYVNHRWYGGLLTNWQTFTVRIKKLRKLEREEKTLFSSLQKKETANLRKQLQKLQIQLAGIKKMNVLPDIMIVVDQQRELTAIREANRLKIPIISILDSNCDPNLIDIPIPGNDDSVKSIKLIINALSNSIIKGKS